MSSVILMDMYQDNITHQSVNLAPVPLNMIRSNSKFEIRPKFAVLWFKMFFTNHDVILHMSRQCNSRDMCKISAEHNLN